MAEQAKNTLSKAAMITIIADRESDIYEEWARTPDAKTHVLTRVCRDRALAESGMLYAAIDQMQVQDVYSVEVPSRPKKRSAHEAKLMLRGLQDFAMMYQGWSLQNEMCAWISPVGEG